MRRTAVTAVFLSLGLALAACGSRVDPAGTGGSAPAAASCVDTSGSSIKIGFLNSRSGTMAISENTVDPLNKQMLFFIASGVLLAMVALARQLMVSRYGELLVACRDAEERVRFLGYDPANVKTVAYMIAAFMAGIAGALFVPIVGIVSPNDVGIVPSIGFLIGVAIGGRTTLLGPVLGAIAVAWAGTTLSETIPSGWTYVQGFLFMLVIAFLPGGLASLRGVWGGLRARLRRPPPPSPVPVDPAEVATPTGAKV